MSAPAHQQDCKITLYWLDQSRAQRIIWLFEELNLNYDLQIFKRDQHFRAPRELKDIHPLGKSPIVGIQAPGAEKPIILAESGSIIEYVAEHFGRELIPKRYPEGKDGVVGAETEEWLRYRYLMHYTEGSLMTILIVALIVGKIGNAPVPFFLKPLTRMIASNVNTSFVDKELKNHMDFLEGYLSKAPGTGEFFCGSSLSGADIQMIFALEGAMRRVPLNETNYPKLHAWVRRMQGREAYKRAGVKVSEASGVEYVPFSDIDP